MLEGMPNWFGKSDTLNDLYNLAQRRQFGSVIGDSLYNFTGFKYYKSSTQNFYSGSHVYAWGSTLLGCMPTGEGKSLVGLMLPFMKIQGQLLLLKLQFHLLLIESQNAKKLYKNRKNVPEAYHF